MNDDVQSIATTPRARGLHIAVAESLTCGALASELGAGPEAADWLRGGVVAYDESVKFDLLGVTPGPLVTERCAREIEPARQATGPISASANILVTEPCSDGQTQRLSQELKRWS